MKDDTLNLRNRRGIMGNGDYDDIVGKVHSFWRRSWSPAAPLGGGGLFFAMATVTHSS